MSGAPSQSDAGSTVATTFAGAAQLAAMSLEACWPGASIVVIWRGAVGAVAIVAGAMIQLDWLEIDSDLDLRNLLDSLDEVSIGSARPTQVNLPASAAAVPLVNGRREVLIYLLGSTQPLSGRDQQLLGGIASLLATVRQRERQNERLSDERETFRREAGTDPLTGLLNRRGFLVELDTHWPHSEDSEFGDVLLLADIRGLKGANDCYGHSVGDQLLIDVADALRVTSLPQDVIGRFGGDEFAVIVCGKTAALRAGRYATDVQRELTRRAADRPTSLTVRFGAQPLSGVDSPSHALELADNAMFRRLP